MPTHFVAPATPRGALLVILVLCLLAALMLLPYVLGPFALRRRFRHLAEPQVLPICADGMPPRAAAHLDESETALRSLGFEPAGRARVRSATCVRAWVSVLVHAEHQTLAQVVAVARVIGEDVYPVEARSVEFFTRWGRRELVTSNGTQVRPFGPVRGQSTVRFSDLRDLSRLHQIHNTRVQAEGSGASAELPAPGEECQSVADAARTWIEAQAARGNVEMLPDEQAYGLTWRGALRATYKNAWPFHGLALRRARAAAQRLVATLDCDAPAEQARLVGTPTPTEAKSLARK